MYLEVGLYIISQQRIVLMLGVHERVTARDQRRRVRGELAQLILEDLQPHIGIRRYYLYMTHCIRRPFCGCHGFVDHRLYPILRPTVKRTTLKRLVQV